MENETPPPADAETQTDVTPDAPPPDAPAGKVTLDDILANRPDWLTAQMHALDEHPFDAEDLAALDHKSQRVIAALVRKAEAEVPAAVSKEQELRQKEQELAARERMVQRRQVDALKPFTDPRVQQLLTDMRPKGEEPEFGTEAWFEWKVAKDTAARFERFLGTFQQLEADGKAAFEQAEAEARAQAQLAADEQYIAANMDTFEDERVVERVTTLVQKHNHTLEDAHRIAMREVVAENEEQMRADAVKLSRERIQRGGRRGPTLPDTPTDPDERSEFYRKYPDALARDYERAFGRPPEP